MKKITLTLFGALFATLGFAQQRTCSTMDNLDYRMQKDPHLHQKMQEIESFTQKRILEKSLYQGKVDGEVITIPVVVHVLYTNTTNNISDAQIASQMQVLNQDFRRTNPDADNTWSQAADTEIQFQLASIDPNGNATTGITRTQVSTSTWLTDDGMKSSSQGGVNPWDTSEYLNMWIVDNITTTQGGTILGYAQFPGGSSSTDGVVMADQYFGTIGTATAPFDGGRTTTHEVGHYLNLRHIWGDGDCSADDFVADTPSSDGANYGCATGHTSCGSVDMVQNYMDYSDDSCMNLFTEGQKTRMRTVLEVGGSRRSLALSDKFGDGSSDSGSDSGSGDSSTCSSTVSSFPYSESFESGDGWTQASGDDGDWINDASGTPSSGTGPSAGADGSYYMFLEASTNGSTGQIGANATAILESPCFDLSSASSATFSFENHLYGSNIGSLSLQATTNGTSWTTLWSLSGDQGNQWNAESVSLASYTGDVIKLRFVGTTGSSWASDIAIDNLELSTSGGSTADTSAPTAPSNVTASNITETTATLSWSSSSDNVGVSAYNVYQGNSLLGSVTGTSASLTGLTEDTTYTYAVTAVDAAGNESSAGSTTFTTDAATSTGGGGSSDLTYCGSEGSDSSYEWIDYVAFGGMANSTGDDGGYADYTNLVASVAPGSTYSVVFSAGFSSSSYTEYWKVWIDYNQDGTFGDDEIVGSGSSSSADNLSVDVTIPTNASLGATTMRVSMKYNADQTACETFSYGEVEDYTVNISNNARTYADAANAKVLGNDIVADVVAYPNPATSIVNVQLSAHDTSLASYRIINTIGQTVKAGSLASTSLNIGSLAKGIYILEVNDGQKILTTKLVKK